MSHQPRQTSTHTWTSIDRLSVIWKSDLTDKIKHSFFQAAFVSILLYGCTTWNLSIRLEKKIDSNYTRMLREYWTSPGGSTPQNSSCRATYHPSRKLLKLDEPNMRDTAGEMGTNSYAKYFLDTFLMNKQKQDDYLEPIYNSSVPIQDIALKTYGERWTDKDGWRDRGMEIRAGGGTWGWWWWYILSIFCGGIGKLLNIWKIDTDLYRNNNFINLDLKP